MKEDSDQKERCNKKAEGKFGFFEDCQSDTTSKKAKKRSLYKQNIFCSSKLSPAPELLTFFCERIIIPLLSVLTPVCSKKNRGNTPGMIGEAL